MNADVRTLSVKIHGIVSRGVKDADIDGSGHLIFTLTDNSTKDLGKVVGNTGPAGPAGQTGPQGPAGATGATGAKIVSTELVSTTAEGNTYKQTFDDGTTATFVAPTGPQGARGERGLQGIQGIPGPAGETGPAGPAGPKGQRGGTGEKGETGATGAKLVSTVFLYKDENGGNVYKQTFDDGTTALFTAPRGEKGLQGMQGAPGPQGEPGSDAEVTAENIQTALGYVPADENDVPTQTSDLTNDSGFLTEHQSLAEYRKASDQDEIDSAQDAAISQQSLAIADIINNSAQDSTGLEILAILTRDNPMFGALADIVEGLPEDTNLQDIADLLAEGNKSLKSLAGEY